MNTNQMKAHIANGGIDAVLAHVYGDAAVEAQKARYSATIDEFAAIYGADRSPFTLLQAEASFRVTTPTTTTVA